MDEAKPPTISFFFEKEISSETEGYRAHYQKLENIRCLSKGWDNYDAEPPSTIACDLATALLKTFEKHGLQVAFVAPTSDASILLKHAIGRGAVTWEIEDDGEIGVMLERDGGEPEYFSPTTEEFDPLLQRLQANG